MPIAPPGGLHADLSSLNVVDKAYKLSDSGSSAGRGHPTLTVYKRNRGRGKAMMNAEF